MMGGFSKEQQRRLDSVTSSNPQYSRALTSIDREYIMERYRLCVFMGGRDCAETVSEYAKRLGATTVEIEGDILGPRGLFPQVRRPNLFEKIQSLAVLISGLSRTNTTIPKIFKYC